MKVAGIYATVAAVWIVASDGMVAWWWDNPDPEWFVDSFKGLMFVSVTALMLHTLIRRLVKRFEAAEAALRLSDERWRFALDESGEGVWDWCGDTNRVFYSSRWKEMLGHGDAEIGDQLEEWMGRIHPDDRPRVQPEFDRHFRGETASYGTEYRVRTKAGSYIWVLSRGRVVRRAPDGRPLRAVGTHSDITTRKATEARITDALDLKRAILDSAPVGIVTYRADGQAVSANAAAAQFVGLPIVTLLQQNFRQLESWRRYGLLEAAERALRENTVTTCSTRIVTSAGRATWADIWFAPFNHGGEHRLLLIVQDTSRQHETLDRLELLNAALEATPTGWVVTDAKGVIEWVNPAFTRLTGYAAAEAFGHTLNLLKSDRHTHDFYANIWQTITSGHVWQGEICNRHKNGSHYYEHMTVTPVRDAEGAISHFVAMKEDITGRRELEQQLARSQRLESIGLLASGIAHDLNNMLAPIMLSTSLIRSHHADRETAELLDLMQGAAQRGAGVVQQVLTFARGVDGERVQIDTRPLVKELAQLVRETFPRQIRVNVNVPAVPLLVEGDITPLHQVLLNLAVNARDAMPEGGVLTLKAGMTMVDEQVARQAPGGKPGPYVKLSVADTGHGIPPEVLEHIFEPFFTTKPRGKGTGLGLSTVYGIVRGHGGFVEVRSTVGAGTEFSVLIPASAKTPAPAQRAIEEMPRVRGAGRRILVVDDEASIRLVTGRLLEKLGFIPVLAVDGFHALEKLRDQPERFSAAILDLMMPGMNGYKLAREIRALVAGLPLIVASGMMGDMEAGEERTQLAAIGVRTVLKKPFTESVLIEALKAELVAGD
jgi:PAS domain S-box-containing protein